MRGLSRFVLLAALGCSACNSGSVISPSEGPPPSLPAQGGAVISYFLPKAQWTFVATFDPTSTASFKPSAEFATVVSDASQGGQQGSKNGSTGLQGVTAEEKTSEDAGSPFTLVTATAAPQIVPDPDHHFYLSYTHAGLSDDTVDIQWDRGMMLKKVSSETSDQTVKALEAVNALLSEITTAQGALAATTQKADQKSILLNLGQTPKSLLDICGEGTAAANVANISTGGNKLVLSEPRQSLNELLDLTVVPEKYCFVALKISVTSPDEKFRQQFFSSQHAEPSLNGDCNTFICFPLARQVTVTVVAAVFALRDTNPNCKNPPSSALTRTEEQFPLLVGKPADKKDNRPTFGNEKLKAWLVCDAKTDTVPLAITKTYDVIVPWTPDKGYVRFDRRSFVDNKTSITFDGGLVSEFQSTDPSAVAGTLTLATDALKSVVLTVPLVR